MRVEAWLIAERTGSWVNRRWGRPIYCFLGNMADGWDRSRPASIKLRLTDFDARMLAFTFPDSMTSCPQLAVQPIARSLITSRYLRWTTGPFGPTG